MRAVVAVAIIAVLTAVGTWGADEVSRQLDPDEQARFCFAQDDLHPANAGELSVRFQHGETTFALGAEVSFEVRYSHDAWIHILQADRNGLALLWPVGRSKSPNGAYQPFYCPGVSDRPISLRANETITIPDKIRQELEAAGATKGPKLVADVVSPGLFIVIATPREALLLDSDLKPSGDGAAPPLATDPAGCRRMLEAIKSNLLRKFPDGGFAVSVNAYDVIDPAGTWTLPSTPDPAGDTWYFCEQKTDKDLNCWWAVNTPPTKDGTTKTVCALRGAVGAWSAERRAQRVAERLNELHQYGVIAASSPQDFSVAHNDDGSYGVFVELQGKLRPRLDGKYLILSVYPQDAKIRRYGTGTADDTLKLAEDVLGVLRSMSRAGQLRGAGQ